MHKFSIIIPHKDCPQLLSRCLDSIELRDDVQVIVVDDDSSSEIVDFEHFPYMDNPHVQIILDKSGKGAGHARNLGLKHADGQWIVFADADDFFVEDMYGKCVRAAEMDSDIVFLATVELNEDLTPFDGPSKISWYLTHYDDDLAAREYMLRYMTWAPWCKVIRRSLIDEHGISFDETVVANDLAFSMKIGYHAARIAWIDEPFYHYIHRSQSLTFAQDDEVKTLERIRAYAWTCSFMQSHGLEWSEVFLYRKLISTMRHPQLFIKALKEISFYKPAAKMFFTLVFWRLTRKRKDLMPHNYYCPIYKKDKS